MTNPNEEGLGGTAAGPTAVNMDTLSDDAERIAVPSFDIVTAPVEGLTEPATRAMPDSGEPETEPPPVVMREDNGGKGDAGQTDTAPSDEHGGDHE
jgi:hypothetical protein